MQSDTLNTVSTFINVHVARCERSIYLAMHSVREFLFSYDMDLPKSKLVHKTESIQQLKRINVN